MGGTGGAKRSAGAGALVKSLDRQNSSPMTTKDHSLTHAIAGFRKRIRAVSGNSRR
jgi:hypothetical protein